MRARRLPSRVRSSSSASIRPRRSSAGYGYRNVTTPAIDALARDGIVYERAYGHSVQTFPAHVALLSGRLPFDTGVRDEGSPLKSGERLLAQMLRDRGYATGGIVSSGMLRRETGIAQGFNFFDDAMPVAAAELTADQLRRDGAESEAIAERWLSTVGSTRLFLFLQLHEPHAPYAPPERFGSLAPYDGAIAYADEILGRLVRYLKANQLYDQSTIVLVSDHGEGRAITGTGPRPFLYDEAIHLPLIIKQAGGADAGRRGRLVQQSDIVPTASIWSRRRSGNLRGQSLAPSGWDRKPAGRSDGACGDVAGGTVSWARRIADRWARPSGPRARAPDYDSTRASEHGGRAAAPVLEARRARSNAAR